MNKKIDEEIIRFLKNLLHPEGFGWSVTDEVRRETKRLLDIIEHERKDTRELS